MDEKSLIFGVSDDLEDLLMFLLKNNVDLDLETDYYLNIPPPPRLDSNEDFGNSVIAGLFVDLNEQLVKTVMLWLQDRKKKDLKNPELEISISGNLLKLNLHDMEILKILLEKIPADMFHFNE
jgi:hypothetical protein